MSKQAQCLIICGLRASSNKGARRGIFILKSSACQKANSIYLSWLYKMHAVISAAAALAAGRVHLRPIFCVVIDEEAK